MSSEQTPIVIGRELNQFFDQVPHEDCTGIAQRFLNTIQCGVISHGTQPDGSPGISNTDCLIVDNKARILDYSYSTLALLRSGGPLRIDCRQCLVASTSQQTLHLHQQISRIAASRQSGDLHLSAGNADVWQLQLISFRQSQFDHATDMLSDSVIIVIQRRLHRRPPGKEVIRCRIHCTVAEASVAAELANGLSPQQIAALRQVSINTIRSQVRALLSHTGTRRISEFVSVVAGL
jgi:DNA-binding CsgD family transcriptional regulator